MTDRSASIISHKKTWWRTLAHCGRVFVEVLMVRDRQEWMAEGGRRLRGRRTDLGLEVEDVAAAIGRSAAQVARYESGECDPMRPKITQSYAAVLRVTSLSGLYLGGEWRPT